ncbi:MAG: hypothetical protein CM15mL6_120 [uncultured marine virus]|nr:MAG: hypothetical protein CM15mL6_120 [uncultured marine virus]
MVETGNPVIIKVNFTIPWGFGFFRNNCYRSYIRFSHRLVPKGLLKFTTVETNITNIVQAGANVADINNFADVYQISNNAPTKKTR